MAVAAAASNVIGELPRNILKAIALGGILIFFVLFLLVTGDGTLGDVLPMLGLYAFAGLRLFPALQQIYVGDRPCCASRRPVLDKLDADIRENAADAAALPRPRRRAAAAAARAARARRRALRLSRGRARRARRASRLAIPARTTVGIVGGTGAGKTTAVDLMLGLLEPQAGELRVDGVPITAANRARLAERRSATCRSRSSSIDDTVSANIAFGLAAGGASTRPRSSARRGSPSCTTSSTGELPQGYATRVGERGRAALGRPAPAHRHRPRALPRPGRADPRRGDERARQPHRAGGDGRGDTTSATPRPSS